MSFLETEFTRIIDVAGATREMLLRDIQNEIPELFRKWEIERYEAKADLNQSIVNIKSKAFNGAFQIKEGEFSLIGKFSFPVALRKKKLTEAFDRWLSHAFNASPEC